MGQIRNRGVDRLNDLTIRLDLNQGTQNTIHGHHLNGAGGLVANNQAQTLVLPGRTNKRVRISQSKVAGIDLDKHRLHRPCGPCQAIAQLRGPNHSCQGRKGDGTRRCIEQRHLATEQSGHQFLG